MGPMTFLIDALMAITVPRAGLFTKLLMTVVFFFRKAQRSRLERVMVHGSA